MATLKNSLLADASRRHYKNDADADERIECLEKFGDGAVIDPSETNSRDKALLYELSAFSFLEAHSYPTYMDSVFTGNKVYFRYRSDLNYMEHFNRHKNNLI